MMSRIFPFFVRMVCLAAISGFLVDFAAGAAPEIQETSTRGIAVMASSIGNEIAPEALAEVVKWGKYSPVVVDWAWVTFHWGQTDFQAVNRFLKLMEAQKVPVLAMYRPRFLENPTVATQMGEDGKRSEKHAEICYSDRAARQWGAAWGTKILEKCPSFEEIIIYNPSSQCRCPNCSEAAQQGRYSAVTGFLSEARSAWREKHPKVKLGVVSVNEPEFWKAHLEAIDVAHPYMSIREEIDPEEDVKGILKVRDVVKEKMGACLAKITWEAGAKVSIAKLKAFDDLAGEGGISYFFWTYHTVFESPEYDAKAVVKALSIGKPAAERAAKRTTKLKPAGGAPLTTVARSAGKKTRSNNVPAGDRYYTPEEIQSTAGEKFLDRIFEREGGYAPFAALQALVQKVKESDEEERQTLVPLVVKAMKDQKRPPNPRFQCCYVLSDGGVEEAVGDLSEVLLKDRAEMMRAVAAEALGKFGGNTAAREALIKAARKEKSPQVRETLSRHLGKEMPAFVAGGKETGGEEEGSVDSGEEKTGNAETADAATAGVEELAPSGPPKLPAGPVLPAGKPLPWPFPGDYKAQTIFNNYQQATDGYIHSGLDFMQPAGTPVTAVESGYVAVIATNYPQWTTHHFFIVASKKGDDRGWCYTHVDPSSFTFKEGDKIRQGQTLGNLVNFSLGGSPGAAHLHFHYVKFSKDRTGKLKVHSLLDPLYYFDWKDSEPPTFQPLRFVQAGGTRQFEADEDGAVTVSGKVEILAAITDSAYPGHMGNLGVPVVMLSISDGKHTLQKLVLDHRGDVGDETQTKPLFLNLEERKAFIDPSSFPRYQMLRTTKTDGDGKITPRDADKGWDTTAKDSKGARLWPNGEYSVNVYAWDIAGNRGVVGAKVRVKNGP